jgi:hypothetical protein
MEGMLYSLLKFGKASERNPAMNPSSFSNVVCTEDFATLLCVAQVSFPVTLIDDSSGDFAVAATDYLTASGFVPGTGGQLLSQNWVGQIIELSGLLFNKQSGADTNPNQYQLITSLGFTFPSVVGNLLIFNAGYSIKTVETISNTGSMSYTAATVFN